MQSLINKLEAVQRRAAVMILCAMECKKVNLDNSWSLLEFILRWPLHAGLAAKCNTCMYGWFAAAAGGLCFSLGIFHTLVALPYLFLGSLGYR